MASTAIKCTPCKQTHQSCSWVRAYRQWWVRELWGITEVELDWRELVATMRPAPSPQKMIKNPLQEAVSEAEPSKKVVKCKQAAGEGHVLLKLLEW